MKTAFLYTEEFEKFDYGPSHPLKILRLKLTCELIRAYGLFSLPNAKVVKPRMADEDELAEFHDREYLEVLKAADKGVSVAGAGYYGLGAGDNPVFKGVFEWSRLVSGASLQAAEMVDSGEVDIAFSISGGLHHASASRASGFCYINDPVVAIMSLLRKGRRVAYIDVDAHHGDGVQEAFYATDKVLTISLHETGRMLFPGRGFEDEIGRGEGKGYSVNVPMPSSSDDELFVYAFNEIVPPLLERFKPDVVVTQLGVDSFHSDPLTHLNYTNNGFCTVVKKIREIVPRWVALGGGGYDVANVAKAWTLAWAIMNDVDLPDELPAEFSGFPLEGFHTGKIRDPHYVIGGKEKEVMRVEVKRVVDFLRGRQFPE